MTNFKGRSFLKLIDFSPIEIEELLVLSEKLKKLKKEGTPHEFCKGKNAALIFEKTSTRTRSAFEVACFDLGMHATYIGPGSSQMGKKESTADTARVLGRMYDGIEFRGFSQEAVEELAKFSGVPVWNGLTDSFHPTQMLADLLTIKENFGRLKGIRFSFFGDARNNMGNSLMIAAAKMGMHFTGVCPNELKPSEELIKIAKDIAKETGGSVSFTDDPQKGSVDAQVVATDIWVSMGEPDSVWEKRIKLLLPYQVNKSVMEKANEKAIFMHCLPSFHDENTGIGKEMAEKFGVAQMEVTNEVFESERSVVFDEAENRLHTIKAVIYATLCGEEIL